MRLKGLDLNLLIAMNILLEERSVSKAADRLFLSQPAVSASLQRLRQYFNDPILVQHGKRMIPTSYAEKIHPEVKRLLTQIERVIAISSEFDPASSEREFKLMASDYITTILVAPVAELLAQSAPMTKLDIRLPDRQVAQEFERGELDLVLTPEEFVTPGHPCELVFEENHVVVGWDQNPVFAKGLTEQDFLESPHVAVSIGPHRHKSFIERQLEEMQINRRIDILAPSFSTIPWFLTGTNRLALMHERLARAFVKSLPLQIAEPPIHFKPMREMMQHHSARDTDAGLSWLREVIRAFAAS